MFSFYFTRLVIVLLSLFIMSGCGGETDEETPKLSTFWPKLDGCILCHTPNGEAENGPDMSTPQLFVKNLVGKKRTDYPNWLVTSDCSDSLPFITAGDASKSTLMAALTEEDSNTVQNENNCSSSFNYHNQNNVSIAKGSVLYNELTEWINAGAINN